MQDKKNNTPFMKIRDASTATGLSQHFLRNGLKSGFVPHVKSGTVYLVNVPALLKKLGVPDQEGDAKANG